MRYPAPLAAHPNGLRPVVPPLLHVDGHGRGDGLHRIPRHGIDGRSQCAHLWRRVPGGHLRHPVQSVPSVAPGLQLAVHLHQPLVTVLASVRQQPHLHRRPAGKSAEGEGQLLHRRRGMVAGELTPQDGGSLLPSPDAAFEVDRLLPRGPFGDAAPKRRPTRVPAPNVGPGEGALQQAVHRRHQHLQGRRGWGHRQALGDRLLVLHRDQRTTVDAAGQIPRQPAVVAELVHQQPDPPRCHVAQGVEAEAVHGLLHCIGNGDKIDRVEGEEGGDVRRDPDGAQGGCGPRRDEGGELAVSQAHPGPQVVGDGAEQGHGQSSLAPVHLRKTVQPDVGDTHVARLHPVADALQRLQHLAERSAVGRFVRFDDHRAGLAR